MLELQQEQELRQLLEPEPEPQLVHKLEQEVEALNR